MKKPSARAVSAVSRGAARKASPEVRASLAPYRAKRDFEKTGEPSGDESPALKATPPRKASKPLGFVIQKHAASHLHFDLRLELDGVMKSWAVPKGPSLDPAIKRLAMEVEDHPMDYNSFEGTIPKGQYGGGTVMLWDRGTYSADEVGPGESQPDAIRRGLQSGKLAFTFHGERLQGSFALVRTRRGEERAEWLLMKHSGDTARPGSEIVAEIMTSVASGRTMEAIAGAKDKKWQSNRKADELTTLLDAFENGTVKAMEPGSVADRPGPGMWALEPYYHGERAFAFAANGTARLLIPERGRTGGRNASVDGLDTADVQRALESLARQHERVLVFDGIVVSTPLAAGRVRDDGKARAALVIVDLLVDDGTLLVEEPWIERRMRLDALLGTNGERAHVRIDTRVERALLAGEFVITDSEGARDDARRRDWFSAVAKRIDARYEPGRSELWRVLEPRRR